MSLSMISIHPTDLFHFPENDLCSTCLSILIFILKQYISKVSLSLAFSFFKLKLFTLLYLYLVSCNNELILHKLSMLHCLKFSHRSLQLLEICFQIGQYFMILLFMAKFVQCTNIYLVWLLYFKTEVHPGKQWKSSRAKHFPHRIYGNGRDTGNQQLQHSVVIILMEDIQN